MFTIQHVYGFVYVRPQNGMDKYIQAFHKSVYIEKQTVIHLTRGKTLLHSLQLIETAFVFSHLLLSLFQILYVKQSPGLCMRSQFVNRCIRQKIQTSQLVSQTTLFMDMPIYPTRIYVAIDKLFLTAYICLRTHLDTPTPK